MLHENPVMHYYFIGRMLGKAIYENMLVEIPFASFFLAKVLARHSGSDVDIHNLSSLDPLMYKNLVFLKNYDGDVSELNLDFTVVDNELGANHTTELKPNGAQVPVTQQNRIEYIHLMADYKLNKQVCLIEWCYFIKNACVVMDIFFRFDHSVPHLNKVYQM